MAKVEMSYFELKRSRDVSSEPPRYGQATGNRARISEADIAGKGISDKAAANAFLSTFQADYNKRFGKPPKSSHDAHRPVSDTDDLDRVFTWQEHRKVTKNLTLHYKRAMYLLPKEMTHLIGKRLCL